MLSNNKNQEPPKIEHRVSKEENKSLTSKLISKHRKTIRKLEVAVDKFKLKIKGLEENLAQVEDVSINLSFLIFQENVYLRTNVSKHVVDEDIRNKQSKDAQYAEIVSANRNSQYYNISQILAPKKLSINAGDLDLGLVADESLTTNYEEAMQNTNADKEIHKSSQKVIANLSEFEKRKTELESLHETISNIQNFYDSDWGSFDDYIVIPPQEVELGDTAKKLKDRKQPPSSGVSSFVFIDIENSTSLWKIDYIETASNLKLYNQRIHEWCREFDGYLIESDMDSHLLVFKS